METTVRTLQYIRSALNFSLPISREESQPHNGHTCIGDPMLTRPISTRTGYSRVDDVWRGAGGSRRAIFFSLLKSELVCAYLT